LSHLTNYLKAFEDLIPPGLANTGVRKNFILGGRKILKLMAQGLTRFWKQK